MSNFKKIYKLMIFCVFIFALNGISISAETFFPISPVLEYVELNSDGTYVAHWGWNNPNPITVTVSSNQSTFTGSVTGGTRTPLNNFAPGRNYDSFNTTFTGTNLVWTLTSPDGSTRTSTASAERAYTPKPTSTDIPNTPQNISGITLDGEFNDWNDKPNYNLSITNSSISQLKSMSWYPNINDGSLYINIVRILNDIDKNKLADFDGSIYFEGDLGERRLDINYHPPSQMISLDLYDSNQSRVWSDKGKWGDKKYVEGEDNKLEFYVPFRYLVSNTTSGYDIDMYLESSSKKIPPAGIIKISTASTFPYTVSAVCIALAFLGLFSFYKRSKQKKKTVISF